MTDVKMKPATISEKELFEEWKSTEISFFDELGRHQIDNFGEELITPFNDDIVIDFMLDGSDDPSGQMEAAEEALENALQLIKLARKSYEALREERIVIPEEPDESNYEVHLAWQRAANQAEKNPRYHPATSKVSDEATFLEDGSDPAPLSKPEFVDMKPEDEDNIRLG